MGFIRIELPKCVVYLKPEECHHLLLRILNYIRLLWQEGKPSPEPKAKSNNTFRNLAKKKPKN